MAMIISCAHNTARVAMNRAVEFVLISMFGASVLNDHLDKIEIQTVEEMVSVEQNLQVELKKVLVVMESKRTDFDNIRQDVMTFTNTT
jgi:hypothetical protein